jgi:hypothetical protein
LTLVKFIRQCHARLAVRADRRRRQPFTPSEKLAATIVRITLTNWTKPPTFCPALWQFHK